jgi:uncharacterized membrane protein
MKRLSKELHPFFLTGIQAFTGALFFAPVLLLPSVQAAAVTWEGVGAILYLGIVVSMGASGLYNYGVSRIPASQASAFVNLIPVFSIILSFLILDERLTSWRAVALAAAAPPGATSRGYSHRPRAFQVFTAADHLHRGESAAVRALVAVSQIILLDEIFVDGTVRAQKTLPPRGIACRNQWRLVQGVRSDSHLARRTDSGGVPPADGPPSPGAPP